jgi:hypothetical protein
MSNFLGRRFNSKQKIIIVLMLIGFTTIAVPAVATALNVQNAPGSNAPGANTLYALKLNPSVSGTVAHIVVNFPPGFVTSNARVFHIQNIGAGHLSIPNSTAISYDVTSPVTITSGTQVVLLLGNIVNTSTVGSNEPIKFATLDSSNFLIESNLLGTLSIASSISDITDINGKVGVNDTTPQNALDVKGNIGLSGNIVANNGNNICIGSC